MFYNNKKVLVTGAGGLLGSQVAKMLVEQGAIVRASYRGRKVPSWVGDVESVKADFMNIEDVKKCVKGMEGGTERGKWGSLARILLKSDRF